MEIGRLARLYDRIAADSARGDVAAAHQAFLAVLGLEERRRPERVPDQPPPLREAVFRYSEPRWVDLVALARGARRAAKFEDLSAQGAAVLARDLASRGLRVRTVGPYHKRFDVSAAEPGPEGRRYSVIASLGAEADAVVEAERDRSPAGTLAAGAALGYPPCCVRHFAAVERGEAAAEDGINEAAIRSTAGLEGLIPWELNTLSALSPVGFTPCSATCAGARAFAVRVLDAVRAEGAESFAAVRRALMRPILFFRYPLFHVLEGAGVVPGEVRYSSAVAAVEPEAPPLLSAWFEAELGVALREGDSVRLDGGALEVWKGGSPIARWGVRSPRVPLLLQFDGAQAM
jgi:hypothetical protein